MYIIIKNNEPLYFNSYIEIGEEILTTNINEISLICIFQENEEIIKNFNFPNANYKLKINHCNLVEFPNNIPLNIQILDIAYNNFISLYLQHLTNLKILKVNNNKIVNLNLPDNLEILYCNNNNIPQTNSVPENLKFLNICNNLLTQPINSTNNNLKILQSNNLLTTNENLNVDITIPIINISYMNINNYEELEQDHHYIVEENENNQENDDNDDNINFIIQNIQTEYITLPEIPNLYDNQPQSEIEEIEEEDNLENINNENKENYLKIIHEINILSEENKINIPNNYLCPISKLIFYNPVCLSDGFTYEKSYIQEWLKNNNKSPMTNNTLQNKYLFKNNLLRGIIIDWIDNIKKDFQNHFQNSNEN